MRIIINQNRNLKKENEYNTQNENKVTELTLEVPEEYENWNKRIVFLTDEGTFWDYIQDNTYLIKKNVTQYERVQFYIWLTNGEQDFRSETTDLKFNMNKEAEDLIPTEEQIDGFNTLITTLNLEITRVTDKETELNGIIADLQHKLDTGYFNGTNGSDGEDGESAYQIWVEQGNQGTEQDFINSLKGQDGTNGTDGQDGVDGKSAYEIWLDEGNEGTEQDFLESLKGADGIDGQDGVNGTNGQDGISPTASVQQTSTGATISITDKNGTTTAQIINGQDGTNGRDGTNGTNGQDGYTPVRGTDYWTSEDIAQIEGYCDDYVDEQIVDLEEQVEDLQKNQLQGNESGTSIDLSDSADSRVKSITLNGNSVQNTSILPSEYQQVEYIESTGTQYIDTGIKTDIDIAIESVMKVTSTTNELNYSGTVYGNSEGWSAFGSYAQGKLVSYFASENRIGVEINFDNNFHKYYLKNGLQRIDDISAQNTISTIPSTLNIYLFKGNVNFQANYAMKQIIKYCKIWENDSLVRNYIPCYRISDNVIGLYDLVSKTFFTNAGTGTFNKGNDVTLPTVDYPQSIKSAGDSGSLVEKVVNKNLLRYPYYNTTRTTNGINFIDNGDGSITINGTATNDAYFTIYNNSNGERIKLKKGQYCFSSKNTIAEGVSITFTPRNSDGTTIPGINALYLGNTINFETLSINQDFEAFANIRVNSGTTVNNFTFYPILEKGLTKTEYEVYQSQIYTIPCQQPMRSIENVKDTFIKVNGVWYERHNIARILSYNGEEITTAYMSTTGELSTGATVDYVLITSTDLLCTQAQITALEAFSKARTYKNVTHIYSEDEVPAEINLTYYKETQTYLDNIITRLEVLESEV